MDQQEQPTLFDTSVDLAAAADAFADNDIAPNTLKAYRRWAGVFDQFCKAQHRTALPATSQTLAEFVTWLAIRNYAPPSIEQALAGVMWNHHDAKADAPDPHQARRSIGGYKRQRAQDGLHARKASPIKDRHIRAMVKLCDLNRPRGLRDRMILTLGKSFAARRSELAALNIDDVEFDDDGWLVVTVRSSKTDQYGHGAKTYVPYEADPLICPVRSTKDWVKWLAGQGVTAGPLLRNLTSKGDKLQTSPLARHPRARAGALGGEAINRLVQRYEGRAGLGLKSPTAHGLRSGAITEAHEHGAPMPSLYTLGRYADKSTMPMGYIRDVDEKQLAAGRFGKEHLDRRLPADDDDAE